jgi:glycosyltransferase involved in cell wall biosynthesis
MKVSIVIPCFNNSRYLPLCLDSALRNIANKDGEIICVDDCSTDDTIAVLELYAEKYGSINIVRHSVNGGTNEARRSGVLAARGDYVLFMDPDDRLTEGIVDVIINKLAEKEVDVLFFDFKFADGFDLNSCSNENSKIHYYKQIQKGHLLAISKSSAIDAIYTSPPRLGVMVWGKAWKRELLIKGFDFIPEGWCVEQEDDCESLMFLTLAESVSMIDYVGYEYRWDSGCTNYDICERGAIRYLRNALFVTRFIVAFKKHFGLDSQYVPYLQFVENNVKDKYEKIAKWLIKSVNDREELLERKCFMDDWMPLTMFCFERENEHARILKTIASIPFLNVMIRLKRIYLKLRMKLTKDASYRRSIENERFSLKKVRSLIGATKA